MTATASAVLLCIGQLVGMVVCLEGGYRLGLRERRESLSHEGLGAIEAAIFALLGLLLGFAFAGAMSRLDARRELILREANAISTAYLRIDLLQPSEQPEMRRLFRSYLEARLAAYDRLAAGDAQSRARTAAVRLQEQIWARAISASHKDGTHNTARVVLPALNDMVDVTTARTVALQTRLPTLILVLLLGVSLVSALVAGYAMSQRARRSLLHIVLYAAAVSLTTYTVLDLDNPRLGLIRLDATERILQQLHDSIR